jgi:hypothetical protein
LKTISKHISPLLIYRIFIGLFLFIAISPAGAQTANDNIDTTVTEEVVPAEEYTEEDEKAEDEYFWEKEYQDDGWMQYKQRKIADSTLKKMQEDDDFWYANAIFNKEQKENKKQGGYIPLGQRTWFQTLIWIIIVGGFVTFLIIYLSGSEIGLFRKKSIPVKTSEEEEEMPEDIFAINYQKEIDKAAAQGNYRLAVRLMFLRLLKSMAEKNVIIYKQDKTNFDYLLQLHTTNYYHDFFRITRHYEYSWYGKFDVNSDAYQLISKEMIQFENQLLRR